MLVAAAGEVHHECDGHDELKQRPACEPHELAERPEYQMAGFVNCQVHASQHGTAAGIAQVVDSVRQQ